MVTIGKIWHMVSQDLFSQYVAFAMYGFNVRARHVSQLLERAWLYYFYMAVTIYEIVGVSIFIVVYRRNLVAVSEALLLLLQSVSSVAKTVIFLNNGAAFLDLIQRIQEPILDPSVPESERETWLITNRTGQRLSAVYYLLCNLSSVSLGGEPFFITWTVYYMTDEFIPVTTFPAVTIYDLNNKVMYVFDATIATLCVVYLTNSTASVDTIFCWYVYNISGYFRIMSRKLEETIEATLDVPDYERWEPFQREIAHLSQYHNRILNLVRDFDQAFQTIVFVEVLVTCLIYCTIMCQYIMPHDQLNIPFVGFYTMVVTLQLVIYGFGGQKIKNEAEKFATQLYLAFPWHKMDTRKQRMMILPLQRSQKDTYISGYFFTLDRPLLVWIFKTAGSVAAVIKAMRDEM